LLKNLAVWLYSGTVVHFDVRNSVPEVEDTKFETDSIVSFERDAGNMKIDQLLHFIERASSLGAC